MSTVDDKVEGLTVTEKILSRLSKKTFLNLWSYSNPYFKKGKELCDLIVICDNNIILFSDKEVAFSINDNLDISWNRWYKTAIKKSVNQLKGAERRLFLNSSNIYLDSSCTKLLPIKILDFNEIKIHLVVVANGIELACKKYFDGGAGSLIFNSDKKLGEALFTIGDENPSGTFVHILDSFTLPLLLQELDTIFDFVQYLEEKEKFIRNNKLIIYTGEEELLGFYFRNFNANENKHTFFNKDHDSMDGIFINEGHWQGLSKHPQYLAKKEADKISYFWDELINRFSNQILQGTSIRHGESREVHEGGVRYMALEPRIYRRILSKGLLDSINSYCFERSPIKISTCLSLSHPNTTYIFIQFPFDSQYSSYHDDQEKRRHYLYACCMAAKVKFANLVRIVGIIMEPPLINSKITSESILLLDCSSKFWSEEMQLKGELYQKKLHVFQSENMKNYKIKEKNFPDIYKTPSFLLKKRRKINKRFGIKRILFLTKPKSKASDLM